MDVTLPLWMHVVAITVLICVVLVIFIPLVYAADDYSGNPMHNQRKQIEEIVKYV